MVDSSYNNGGSALICSIDTITSINVNALPTARLLAPVSNAYFCSNDTLQRLIPDNSISGLTHSFSSTTGGIATSVTTVFDTVGNTITFYSDTSFYFNPTAVSGGTHIVTQITTDSLGCQDSTRTSFIVNLFQTPDFTIDSTYCASSDSIALYGFPGGGIFTLNGDTLNASGQNAIPYFYPIRRDSTGAVATQTVYDTIVYSISDTACISIKERVVKIYPFPQISFATNSNQNTYCLGGDTVQLIGFGSGTFSGNGVRTATNHFIPDLAGPGFHPIRYYYQDSTTLCDNEFVDTIKVYGTPNLDFTVEGGCQLDSSFFYPNNANLGLDNIFQNNIIDSITSIKWVFTTSDSLIGSSQGNTIDSVGYRYPTSGIYYPTLIVTNQYLCTDTQTIRLVISPTVNSYPYTENFENSAGSWFAESRDSSYSSLWEWGIDTNSVGSIPNSFNHIWMTNKDGGYGPAEDAWVYSPCFDISTLSRPMISLDYWTDTRQQADGTILEYQKANGSWAPVGELDRGINWFNTPFIAGDPGDTTDRIFPIGWSGQSTTWQNGRYKLDDYRGTNNVLRLRMAFASVKNDPQGLYDGFAFDNVVVQNRTRNVLLETMTNVDFVGMETANNHIYQLALNSSLNKDVVLLQYHMENPNPNDIFYNHNPTLGRNRAYEYSAPAGRAFIDGYDPLVTFTTFDLRATDFEYDMLQFPKFSIVIDTFLHVNSTFEIQATVTALENLDSADYRVYTVICEDSLTYPRGSGYGSPLYAVARENDQFHTNTSINTNNIIKTPWVAGQAEPISFIWNHGTSGFINYRPNKFHAIVFIQNIDTKEVYQVATTRAIGGYWVGIDPIQAEKELNELQSLKLFPNPAHDYFNLQFDQALEHDYEWKLVNMQGVEVQQGHIQMGTDQVRIDGLDYPSGAYILLLYNNNVFVQRKVVLGRP
ncbi:MAG: T9SS type A sorting domain-containing protein [Aureispira sp.]